MRLGGNFMVSMDISLPEQLRDFVLQQVQSGYGSASEYIRELIRADEAKKRQERLEADLLEGLASGRGKEITDSQWQALKDAVTIRHQNDKTIR